MTSVPDPDRKQHEMTETAIEEGSRWLRKTRGSVTVLAVPSKADGRMLVVAEWDHTGGIGTYYEDDFRLLFTPAPPEPPTITNPERWAVLGSDGRTTGTWAIKSVAAAFASTHGHRFIVPLVADPSRVERVDRDEVTR